VAAGNQVTMPAQHRVRPYQQPQAPQARFRKPVQQRRQPRPVGRVEPYPLPIELTLQHRELMAQGEDLGVLVAVASRQQSQLRERVRDPQVRQSQQHDPASSRSHHQRWTGRTPQTIQDQSFGIGDGP
jgi:hypothetical protein